MTISSDSHSQPRPIHNTLEDKRLERITSTIHLFLADMEYEPLKINSTNEELERFMWDTMISRGIQCIALERVLHLAASFVELCYPMCSLEEKKIIALFNWFLIYVDDQAPKISLPVQSFQARFITAQPQLDPVLSALADVLSALWTQYDPLSANGITNSALNFLTSCCVENDLETTPLIPGIKKFAWFMREGNGIARAYGSFGFTMRRGFKIMDFVQAVPDIEYWIDLTNDLLSFYKEELAGDTTNYVHIRARNESKSSSEVLKEIEQELVWSRDAIHAVLEGNPGALETWKAYEQGYIHWHLTQSRYKLKDLGL